MTRMLRHSLPLLAAGLLCALPAIAQNAPGAPGGGQGGGARTPQPPKNLKVLPPDTNIGQTMRAYTQALGVTCDFCHAAADPATGRSDRSLDTNPMKNQARVMIQMTMDLNNKYLPMLANRDTTQTIGCGTCHRGEKIPAAFVPPAPPAGQGGPGGQGGGQAGAPPRTPGM